MPLPPHLLRYFWEHGSRPPTLEGSRYTVIRRLLESGGWEAVEWLREHVGDADLREFIQARRGRGMAPKRLRFWALILDLPTSEVDAWIAGLRTNPWYTRTGGRE